MTDFFRDLSRAFRLADFFDIAIIAVFFYAAITWVRQTASRSMLAGFLVVLFIYFLARTFDLYLTSSLFQAVFAVLVVALVVVFQEDLRRLFERIALLGTFRERRRQVAAAAVIDNLIEALNELAEQRVGALVVVKGREPLERHIEGGVVLNGRLSKPLLYSLFDPHSPGHDGALLLEGERITRFGCHLPLSKNLKEVGMRGTRHAAALGLSEVSDALILAVSEERGTISAAEAGRLESAGTAAELKERLERFWQDRYPSASGKQALKTFFRQNAWVKVLSLVLACLTWFLFAYQAETLQRSFVVPIEYRNLPKGWVLKGPKTAEAKVTLSGSERAFDLVNPANLAVSLDLSHVQEGRQEMVIAEENLRGSSSNLSLYRVEPSAVSIEAHEVVTVTLPVRVQTEGKPPPGVEIRQIRPLPQKVQAQVWRSLEADTELLFTEPVSLSGVRRSQQVRVSLLIPEHVRLVEPGQSIIQVSIAVKEEEAAAAR